VVRAARRATTYLSEDFLGGSRLLKLAWVVNFQKGLTAVWVAGLMAAYGNTSTVAWVYLALHGSYGLCWLMKDAAFPDPRWQTRVTVGGGVMAFLLVLGPYWLFPWLLISGVLGSRPEPAPALLAGAIALHTLGVAVMLSADSQKFFTRRYRPGLIGEGMWARTRHPNYLGEMMIYASYALLVRHWIPWAILAWVWTAIFLVSMLAQEASLSRYPGWAAYRARTGFLLPRLRSDDASRKAPSEPARPRRR
jgi:protein-S-isoprenylcysteine O-methyltransferase Ste14